MSEQSAEQETPRAQQVDEGPPEEEATEAGEESGGGAEPSAAQWAIRGAVVGAVAGSAVGAGIGAVLVRRPETIQATKEALDRTGRQVARAAALAASEVVTSKSLNELIQGAGNGDRAQLMKRTAKDAAAAAVNAARDAIVSIRQSERQS